ncbi:sensor histidine kinase [Pseudoflavitalea sp. G-6-1-2]|uniref:tetratricopeptide repeat-containing sensor histidine kinase n=1 Tax=Pseudoflavitalea sp. G-6-1-2 TaxID=2728841 RepID=UPI00146D82C8|nr:tetratricopeptide repeat-containing sensor histidine kinase [Pseudoflavitalea sp. G-6-1-2]NML20600.1 sensor histidine kinase [Pseudoflavitalea sp. G-6-1-2]
MRPWLFILLLIVGLPSLAQVDTAYLKSLYDRCLDFSEDRKDSIRYYAGFIEESATHLKFNKGEVLSSRLKGIVEEMSSNYEAAINYYLQSLEAARKLNMVEYEISALSDLAILYANIKEPQQAKNFYLQAAKLSSFRGDAYNVVSTYNNLAVIYMQLRQYDSARILLSEALRIGKPFEKQIDITSTYNNLGSLNFKEKKYDEALPYFRSNLQMHTASNNAGDLWVDLLNLADLFTEKKNFDSAAYYADRTMELARKLDSRSKEADSYAMLAKLAEYKEDYYSAYDYLKQWYALDTAIVNGDTHQTIAELQERYNAKEREAANKLLKEQVEKETLKAKGITLLAIALAIIGILIAIAFMTKRNANRRLQATNQLILQQNEKLAELNHEKNSLISIVSHDLNTPFATIQVWGHLMAHDADRLSDEQHRALGKIIQASNYGEGLIRRILDVEKKDIGSHKLQLENFDLTILTEDLVDNFQPMAKQKEIKMHVDLPEKELYILSDKHLVSRICENLFSNAIKYTPRGKNVYVSVNDEQDAISIKVRDEGVGIDKEEMPYLFSKYSKISSQPTEGENSNGLGLSIVKRIVEEINGKISCESEPGQGSLFTVILRK